MSVWGVQRPGVSRVRSESAIREELQKLENVRSFTSSDRVWNACQSRIRTLRWVLGESEDGPGQALLPRVQGAARGPDPKCPTVGKSSRKE